MLWRPAIMPASATEATAGRDSSVGATPPRTSRTCSRCSPSASWAECCFRSGELTKQDVRARAGALHLPTAAKPDSQEVCFVAAGPGQGPRERFLAQRIELHAGRLVDRATGSVVGAIPAVELVTVGQRRGLGASASGPRYALEVDMASATVLVGPERDLLTDEVELTQRTWVAGPLPVGAVVLAQTSAHGRARPARLTESGLRYSDGPHRRVAPGQTVALYSGDEVVGAGVAA